MGGLAKDHDHEISTSIFVVVVLKKHIYKGLLKRNKKTFEVSTYEVIKNIDNLN